MTNEQHELPPLVFNDLPDWERQRIVRLVDFRFPDRQIVWGWQRIAKVAGCDWRTCELASEGRLWPKHEGPKPMLSVWFRQVPHQSGRLKVGSDLYNVLSFRKSYWGLPEITDAAGIVLNALRARETDVALAHDYR